MTGESSGPGLRSLVSAATLASAEPDGRPLIDAIRAEWRSRILAPNDRLMRSIDLRYIDGYADGRDLLKKPADEAPLLLDAVYRSEIADYARPEDRSSWKLPESKPRTTRRLFHERESKRCRL